MASLKDKIVFITGGSRGIGAEIAKLLADEGCRIVISHYDDHDEAHKVIEECKQRGAKESHMVELNQADDESIRNTVEQVVEFMGHIDILINNAGVIVWNPLRDQTFEDIEWVCRVNLEGLIKLTRTALPHVKEQILNIASKSGQRPHAELAPYCATKYGLRGFTQTLALEEPALRIVAINPSRTATGMTDFEGASPEAVAKIIVETAKGEHAESGGDVNVYEMLS